MIFNLHGIRFKVDSKNSEFLEYLKFRFQKFFCNKDKIDIRFCVKFNKFPQSLSFYERRSPNFYSHQNKFIIKKENVVIFYDLNNSPLEVTIYFYPKKTKHLARLFFKGKKDTWRDYYEHFIIWRGIQNTLLALLEQKGLSVLHASAIKSDLGATLFFGLGGIGKTTLALNLAFSKNLKLMGDNFILTDGKNTYPFLEPITITNFKKRVLGSRLKQLLKKNENFNSYFLRDNYSYNSVSEIKNMVFLGVSQKSNLTQMNKSKSLKLIENTLKILGETPEFTELNMVFSKKKIKFNSKIRFYKLNYKNFKEAEKIIEKIL